VNLVTQIFVVAAAPVSSACADNKMSALPSPLFKILSTAIGNWRQGQRLRKTSSSESLGRCAGSAVSDRWAPSSTKSIKEACKA
jgi:hypothetical protein